MDTFTAAAKVTAGILLACTVMSAAICLTANGGGLIVLTLAFGLGIMSLKRVCQGY